MLSGEAIALPRSKCSHLQGFRQNNVRLANESCQVPYENILRLAVEHEVIDGDHECRVVSSLPADHSSKQGGAIKREPGVDERSQYLLNACAPSLCRGNVPTLEVKRSTTFRNAYPVTIRTPQESS